MRTGRRLHEMVNLVIINSLVAGVGEGVGTLELCKRMGVTQTGAS